MGDTGPLTIKENPKRTDPRTGNQTEVKPPVRDQKPPTPPPGSTPSNQPTTGGPLTGPNAPDPNKILEKGSNADRLLRSFGSATDIANQDRLRNEADRVQTATTGAAVKKQAAYRGQGAATRKGTLLTGLLGLTDEPSVGRKSLLGQ